MNYKQFENLEKGKQAYKKVKKYLDKTLFRWKPDYEQAARFSREAVKYFKMAGAHDMLMFALKDSGDSHMHIQSYHTAASEYENLAKLYEDRNEIIKASEYYRLAADNYSLNESYNKFCLVLTKSANMLAETFPEAAIKLLNEACQIYKHDYDPEMHEATYKKAVSICIKHNKYEDAIKFMRDQIPLQMKRKDLFEIDVYRNILSIIIVNLYTNHLDKAIIEHNKQQNTMSYKTSDEYYAASDLLDAYVKGNSDDLISSIEKHSTFKYLHTPIGRLIRLLKIGEDRLSYNKNKEQEIYFNQKTSSDDESEDDESEDDEDYC